MSGQSREGSGLPSSSSVSDALEEMKIPLSSSMSSDGEGGVEDGSTMPSARRYARKGCERGIRRALGVVLRYLVFLSSEFAENFRHSQWMPEVV